LLRNTQAFVGIRRTKQTFSIGNVSKLKNYQHHIAFSASKNYSSSFINTSSLSHFSVANSGAIVATMAEKSLVRLASRLGHSCRASIPNNDDSCTRSSGEEPSNHNALVASGDTAEINNDPSNIPPMESCTLTFPSFSLQHLCEVNIAGVGPVSPSREEVQAKASSLLSRPLVVSIDNLNGGEWSSSSFSSYTSSPQQMMLQNVLDSFDELVDARIRAYSKILRNHYLSLAKEKCNNSNVYGSPTSSEVGTQIVEYKLRTLLEFGTNISFGSITTTFVPRPMTEGEELGEGISSSSSTSLPVLFTVDIEPHPFSPILNHRFGPDQETSPNSSRTPSSAVLFPKKLSFRARGFLHGEFWLDGNSFPFR
jgi:hypothetical protein